MFRRIKRWFITLWHSLFYGMKTTEETFLTQYGTSNDGVGISVNQQAESQRVSHALLRGELTQEVKELRHRTYHVDRESRHMEYFSPTLVIKRESKLDNKFVKYENADNCEIITIQPNHATSETILDGLKEFDGERKLTKYTINITRDFIPSFRLEAYTKRLVVREREDKKHYLDFYVSIYPDDKDYTTAGFLSEVKRIKDDVSKPTIFDVEEVSFVTSHAYHLHDMIKFVYRNVYYKEIVEFDGFYIIRFIATPKYQYDLMDDFYCKEQDDKYKNKVKKNIAIDLFGYHAHETYECERCGKVITYDTDDIDSEDIGKPREIDEEIEETSSTLEFRDIQIAEATFGKRLCKDCLKEYLEQKKNFK